jgi:hypothetical protein
LNENAADDACLAEMKSYASLSVASIANGDDPPLPLVSACKVADTAQSAAATITGIPKAPSTHNTTYNLATFSCVVAR